MDPKDMNIPISPNSPIVVQGKPLSPVHWSRGNGVHADHGLGAEKVHVPFSGGQTTLPTFRIGGRPTYENDRALAENGGTLRA
jgi:hypothetical protein